MTHPPESIPPRAPGAALCLNCGHAAHGQDRCNAIARQPDFGRYYCRCKKTPQPESIPTRARSARKPHNDIVGYVCELRNRRTGVGHVVIYDRNKGFDCDADYRYVISCETHNTMTSAPSMPRAREIMKAVDFCEECMAVQS